MDIDNVTFKKNNRLIITIVALILGAVLLFIMASLGTSFSSASKLEGILSLGDKYLTELDHENALAEFLNAIKIDPKDERGYIGAAKAYLGLEKTTEAVDILVKGFDETASENIKDFLEKILKEFSPFDINNSIKLEFIFGEEYWKDILDSINMVKIDYKYREDFNICNGNHLIEWKDPEFEKMMREAINKPDGELWCEDFHFITGLVITEKSSICN